MSDIKLFFLTLIKITAAFSVLFFLAACERNRPVTIAVTPVYQQQVLACNKAFSHMGESWRYQQLQFFISELDVFAKAVDSSPDQAKNSWRTWPLLESEFQSGNVALLGQVCSPGGNQSSVGNWQLHLAPAFELSSISRIRFTLGIPFALNHQNPLTQKSPFNVPSMFWVWRTGHKFLRLDMVSDDDNWLFHLGSTGCPAVSPVRPPAEQCRQPNRFQFELAFDSKKPELLLDLSRLLTQVALTSKKSCQSAPDNPHCRQILANLSGPGSLLFRGSDD
ncbi:MbnP family copper-binding protein [Thalassomonas haliotis]|uniref:Metallo-mystery pair system four-Cys motif protein n=1 Tax=Thalassomonas haliotis TaxID=485448 RepID=A0ABY7VGN8_9GAMM|nr:MbnP family copper-binding protein [Thalassomonas haliotis]WDE12633.1 metallo-mystery pair system four-Cys motif protein [Thalassomonas haliotis]